MKHSIITVNYNNKEGLRKTIESVSAFGMSFVMIVMNILKIDHKNTDFIHTSHDK